MAGLRALVVDDEPLAAERLVRLCARIDGVEVVGVAADGRAALAGVEALRPDVLLLDISMPGLDGMALAGSIASRGGTSHGWGSHDRGSHDRGPHDGVPAIVFVTAHDRHAVDAFALAATDYLLKPVSAARLEQALARVAAARPPDPAPARGFLEEIWAPHGPRPGHGPGMARIAAEALDLAEAERDYVRLHAEGRSYLVRMTLGELEGRLDPARFLRVHRSTLVARDRITALAMDPVDGWTVSLSSGHRRRVGRSYRPRLRGIAAGPGRDDRRAEPDGP